MAKPRYKEQELGLGFTSITEHGVVKPQCVIRCEMLSNEALKENIRKRHFKMKHNAFLGKERSFLKDRDSRLNNSGWLLQTAGLYAFCSKLH
jgi:hypothetical protein